VAVRGNPPAAALSLGVIPFLPGDALKIAAALSIGRLARPLLEKYKK
jgi:biotin transporter BioY